MQNALYILVALGLFLGSGLAKAQDRIGVYPEYRIIAAARSDKFVHAATQFFRINGHLWAESTSVFAGNDENGLTYTVIFSYTSMMSPFGQAVGVVLDANLDPIVYILSE